MRATNWMLTGLLALATGCGAASDTSANDGVTTDEIASSAWQNVVGAFVSPAPELTMSIVFENSPDHRGHHFFRESYGTLIHCTIGSTCTSTHARTDGYYSATSTHITLHPEGAPAEVYTYTLSSRGHLTMTRSGNTSAYDQTTSGFCDEWADCAEEGLNAPRCAVAAGAPEWACTTDHACHYNCGGAVPGATEGSTCGGIAAITCQSGLTCWYDGGAPSFPDQGGVCRRVVGEGQSCGGFVRWPALCDTGLTCRLNVSTPDLPGTCRR